MQILKNILSKKTRQKLNNKLTQFLDWIHKQWTEPCSDKEAVGIAVLIAVLIITGAIIGLMNQ